MTQQKSSLFSRRSLLTDRIGRLIALAALPVVVQACGTPEAQQSGTSPAAPAKTKRKSSADAKTKNRSEDENYEALGDLGVDDQQTAAGQPAVGGQGQGANSTANGAAPTQTQQPAAQLTPNTQVNPGVTGARPDGGFFSRGAPALSLAQITAGQAITAKCEGGLHELQIEPEHLQALAQGQTVKIKSSTHTHLGNPTVHNHTVTYSPIMG